LTFGRHFFNIKMKPLGAFFKPMKLGNIPGKITTFLKEVRLEMKKVSWPTRQQTIRYTLIVIGVSLAVAAFLGALDFIFNTLLTKFVL